MVIEQTVEIPENGILQLELPRSIPAGVKARVEINIPAVLEASINSSKSRPKPGTFRGVLKDRGITLERFREMQKEDLEIEDKADARLWGRKD